MDAIYSKVQPDKLLFKHISHNDLMLFGDRMQRSDWSDPKEFLQVASITTGPQDHDFAPHIHITNERQITETQESWYVVTGSVDVRLYDIDASPLGEVVLEAGDLLVTFAGGHEYRQRAYTLVLEHKNGPYKGRDADKRLI